MLRRYCSSRRSPLHADDGHSKWEIPHGSHARGDGLFSLREHQSRLSALADHFLFRERLRPSRPPVFFLPGTCEEKQRGRGLQRSDASKIALDPAHQASSWSAGQEEEGANSRYGWTTPQAVSLKLPITPFNPGCRVKCVCCKFWARSSAQTTTRFYSGKNKTQTFSKREQISSSISHECPAPMQPVTRTNPTPCHEGRGLACHPRSVVMGYRDYKMRLFTPIRSKTPTLQRHGLHLGAKQGSSRSSLRGDESAGKENCRNGSSSSERVRLLHPLLPCPQKGWWPPAHHRSQTPESRPHEKVVQDDYAEADPLADSHRGLVIFSGPERCILSHPDSPPSQTIYIRLRGSGLSVHGPTLWTVSGSPHFYKVHGRSSFPSKADGNPHSQLPRRLARFGPVGGRINITQDPPPQPLRAPGTQSILPRARCPPASE